MTLLEISELYAGDAARICLRIRQLTREAARETDPQSVRRLRTRIDFLRRLQREVHNMAERTAHYYDAVPSPRLP